MNQKRERFWGLHFDFHADNHHPIGTHTRAEDIEAYMDAAQPTFIQCDVKGHFGYSSYPTKVGIAAEQIEQDNLRIWCETAHRHGLPIYAHYSGLVDTAYGERHPEEVLLDEAGAAPRTGGNNLIIGFAGNYVDELMIPQIKELISEYRMDGIWIDGDCWAVRRNYAPAALASAPGGLSKEEYSNYTRELYLHYLRHVVDEIHAFEPAFHVMSNWAFSSYMPEEPKCGLDSLSGDFTSVRSVASARFEGRCLAAQQKPWDLMTWGFVGVSPQFGNMEEKPAEQLCQEAAAVLSLGGGFQVYIPQDPSGAAPHTDLKRIRETAAFVKLRYANFGKPTAAQTAVFYSGTARYRVSSNIYTPSGTTNALNATVQAVLDTQYTADIVMEHHLERLNHYEIVTVPEWTGMSAAADQALLAYAGNGGHLIVIGANACAHFGELTGSCFPISEDAESKYIFDPESGCFAVVKSRFASLGEGAEPLYASVDLHSKDIPAYRTDPFGKGSVTWIPFDFGTHYNQRRSFQLIRFLKRIYASLVHPVIEINRREIDLTMQKTGRGLYVNLLNLRQNRTDQIFNVYDEVPAVNDVELLIHTGHEHISSLYGTPIEWEKTPDGLRVHISSLHIHTALELW